MQRWLDWAIGAYLVFAAVQAFGIGMTGLILPPEMQIPLRLTPLNARFVAALYVAGGMGVLLAPFCTASGGQTLDVRGFRRSHVAHPHPDAAALARLHE
jgi:hypothetical protein